MALRGERKGRAVKPRRRYHRDVARLFDLLDGLDEPGHLGVALVLLDLASGPRERIVGDLRRLRTQSARDGTPHDRGYLGDDFGITVVALPPRDARDLPNRLSVYCTAKKYQLRKRTWLGLGVYEGPEEIVQAAFIANGDWVEDPDLEALVETLPSYGHEDDYLDG